MQRLLLFLAVVIGLQLSGLIASSAQAAIYWVNFDGIGRANLDGSNAEPVFLSGQERHFMACSVAVSDKHIYWGDMQNSLIGRANLDGTEQVAFVNYVTEPCALALDGEHLFWISRRYQSSQSVGRVNLDGTEPIPQLIQGQEWEGLCGLAVSDGHVYFSSNRYDRIGRATTDGKAVEPEFIGQASYVCGLAISGGQIFWSGFAGTIGRVNLDGSELQPALISGLGEPCAVASNGSQIFFAEYMSPTGFGVSSANLDGTSVRRGLIPGTFQQCSVAVDAVQVPAKTPPPPRPIRCEVGNVKRNPRTGVAFVLMYTEGGSKVAVTNRNLRSRDLNEQQPWSFNRLLKVWPGGKGKAGRHLRQRLRRTGRAELKLRIDCATADPTLASSSTEVPLTLRQTPKPRHKARGINKPTRPGERGVD
jgi:hypothetical protein